jgi:hypothetical protein
MIAGDPQAGCSIGDEFVEKSQNRDHILRPEHIDDSNHGSAEEITIVLQMRAY